MIMRLDKMLAHIGYGSRKEVKELIRKGEVTVNDIIIRNDDYKIDSEKDEVVIFEESVNYLDKVYIMLNKPSDVVSATFDFHKKTVLDLCEEYRSYKIFPVGRLDIDTVGLLLLSNDGKLAYNLLSPKTHVDKTYEVTFTGEFKDEYYKQFEKGIILEDGYKTLPAKIKLLNNNLAHLTIHEGKFHQVKRMFASLNMEVTFLKRISFGPLVLDNNLKEGEYRLLNDKEIESLINHDAN